MKKNISRVLSLILVLVMVLGVMPTALADGLTVTISGANTTTVGEPITLTAYVTGAPDGAEITYEWGGEAEGSADTVEFTPTATGSYVINVTASYTDETGETPVSDSASASTTITVTEPEVEKTISVSPATLSLVPGSRYTLTADVSPEGTDVTWSSSNDRIATVDSDGSVTARSLPAGQTSATATITASAGDGVTDTCVVTVRGNVVQLSWDDPDQELEMSVGQETNMNVAIEPFAAESDATIRYTSDDTSVVYVDSYGNLTARAPGEALITATLTLNNPSRTEYTLGEPSVCTLLVTVSSSAYIACDNETTDGSSITLEPTLYYNGRAITSAEFDYVASTGLDVTAFDNQEFRVEPDGRDSGSVRFTLKENIRIDSTTTILTSDVAPKTVYVSFCETASLRVEVREGISSFRFDDNGIAASATYGLFNSSVVGANLSNYSLMELINLVMPGTGTDIDYYEFSVTSSSGGELIEPNGTGSWITGNKRVSEQQVDYVGFRQKSSTNDTTVFTISALDGNVAVGAVDVTLIVGDTSAIEYETTYNEPVSFKYSDFVNYWNSNRQSSSSSLSYVYFDVSTKVPAYGDLYTTTARTTEVTRSMKFVPSSSGSGTGSNKTYSLSGVTYMPASYSSSYTVEIPFTAYGTRNDSLSGYVVINLNGSDSNIGARGTTLGVNGASSIASNYRNATGKTLGYVVFTLPSAQQATLYRSIPSVGGYSRVTEAQRVMTGDQFYYNYNVTNSTTYKSLENVSLVPAAGFSGTITLKYTAYTSSGSNPDSGTITYKVQTKDSSAVFSDITSRSYNWAADSVDFLYYEGIAQGSNGRYNPSANITRGDFMLMLYRAFLEEDYSTTQVTSNFSDVVNGSTSYAQETYKAVGIAKYLGIAQGTNGKFNPKANITREEAMVLIHRTLEETNRTLRYSSSTNASSFGDYRTISSWATTAISDLVGHGVIQGSNNKISPKTNITRAEMACILHRVITY